MKKFASLLGAGALLLGLAVPALAAVTVINGGAALQGTFAGAGASTGDNSYTSGINAGSITQSGDTTTGDAGAGALAQSMANEYDTEVWAWDCECDVVVANRGLAGQETVAEAGAATGDNSYTAGFNSGSISQSGDTTTGDAGAAAVAQSWANIYTTSVNTWPFPFP
ncbi:MAG: hypothetical protein ACOYT7_03665 [Patescibacteria group bacterium]